MSATAKVTAIAPVSNGARGAIEAEFPYEVTVTVEGVCPMILHAWNVEAQERKSQENKGSRGKKSDDLESYVYRNEKDEICIPGTYIRAAILTVARYHQDPRSPRKMMVDLIKQSVFALDELASLGTKTWDYVDRRRMVVQRAGITRSRPAFDKGWKTTFKLQVTQPQYISPEFLNQLIQEAGRLAGLGDSRPTFGRFQVVNFKVNTLTTRVA